MIIGDGDIASVLLDRSDRLYFASGVSNSQESRQAEYDKELNLLMAQDHKQHLVYFSSLSIFYQFSPYTEHKKLMERLIKNNFKTYTIVRLGNILWGSNPHTLINYLKAHPEAEIQNVYRYVIDKDEFLHWMQLIPDWSVEMNCPGRRMKVKEIKEEFV